MSVYEAWRIHLMGQSAETVTMTFDQLAALVPTMPSPARSYAHWWSNENVDSPVHIQCKSWLTAGFLAEVDIAERLVTFTRRPLR